METSAHMTRIVTTDSERTRLLKEVLRSSAAAAGKSRLPEWKTDIVSEDSDDDSSSAPSRQAMPRMHRLYMLPQARPVDLAAIAISQNSRQSEQLASGFASSSEQQVLRDTGRRITSLCNQLGVLERDEESSISFADSTASWAGSRDESISILPGTGTMGKFADQAVARAISESARWPRLEELHRALTDSSSIEEVRAAEFQIGKESGKKIFPIYHRVNPGLAHLTNARAASSRSLAAEVPAKPPMRQWKEERRVRLSIPRGGSLPALMR